MHTEKQIAKALLDIEAVFLRPNDPFTWASGIQAPIYCDNRLILSYPDKRDLVVDGFVSLIKRDFPDAEVLMGTATAGIPWAACVAQKLNLPMGYVRSANKSHGKGNKIEGHIAEGQKVVVIEDLISTGGSSKGVVEALNEAGAKVLGVAAIFTYRLPAAQAMYESLHIPFSTLSNYDTLIEVALENQSIKVEDQAKLNAWKQNPNDAAWIRQ